MRQRSAQFHRGCLKPLGVVLALLLSLESASRPGVAQSEIRLPREGVPTMYWAEQRFGQGVVREWRIRRQSRLVRVKVTDDWYQLPYFDRYRMVTGFGDVAARQDYRLVVLGRDNRLLATYDCGEVEGERRCNIDLNPIPDPL